MAGLEALAIVDGHGTSVARLGQPDVARSDRRRCATPSRSPTPSRSECARISGRRTVPIASSRNVTAWIGSSAAM